MNEQQTFERIVAESVSDLGPLAPSDGAIERTLKDVDRRRQRPRWLALIKEPPMRTNNHLAVGSPTVRVIGVMTAALVLVIAMALAGVGAQRLLASDDIVVAPDGSGHHTTIAEAVAAAADGDTILVRPGTYDESITIDKDVTIRGDGDRDEIVIANSEEMPAGAELESETAFALAFDGSAATVENLSLQGESSRIEIVGGAPTLQNLRIDAIGRVFGLDPGSRSVPPGILVEGGSTTLIRDNDLRRSTLVILGGSSPRVIGNVFDVGSIGIDGEGTDPVIEDNAITAQGSWHAMNVFGAARPTIRGNTITSEMSGIFVRYSGWPSDSSDPHPIIEDNTIEDSRVGIQFTETSSGDVIGNRLNGNSIGISHSASASDRGAPTLEGNIVRGGDIGLMSAGDPSPRIVGNDIAGAQNVGLRLSNSSAVVNDNTICDNVVNVQVSGDTTPQIDDSNEICEDGPAG